MTTNELQAAREAYEEAPRVTLFGEIGEFVSVAIAGVLIAALEAHAAAQQQRIERLEAALDKIAGLPDEEGRDAYNEGDLGQNWALEECAGIASEALRDESGAE